MKVDNSANNNDSFSEKVYKATGKIPKGRVSTYKAIGDSINSKAYQAIGQILARNPDSPTTPCHRVVKSDGTVGGFMGNDDSESTNLKAQMLMKEGIMIKDHVIVEFENLLVKKL